MWKGRMDASSAACVWVAPWADAPCGAGCCARTVAVGARHAIAAKSTIRHRACRAVKIKHIFAHVSRHLSVRQFPAPHRFVLPNERHGQVDSTPPCAHEHEYAT